MRFQVPRGTHDVLPSESPRWQHLERVFGELAALYGYREVRTPAFEDYELFARSSGETSEVVNKQMYDFLDKGDRRIALKPEGTAPAIRSYIENSLGAQGGVTRLWYMTPIFRYERPALGRYRQAHQFGLELIGSPSPEADAEIIEITCMFYRAVGIGAINVLLNSIGRTETRQRYREALMAYAEPYLKTQDAEARERAAKNPLRMLDSKDPGMQSALEGAPSVLDYLEDSSKENFERLQELLTQGGIPYTIKPEIVRGLDYYTDTVFEVQSGELGANNSLCGGGRYDNLIKELGGADTPSVGVGIGIERALIVAEALGVKYPEQRVDVMVVAATDSAREEVAKLARVLRSAGCSVVIDLDRRNLKAQLKQADRVQARYAALIGDDELATGSVTLRDLASGEQQLVKKDELLGAMQ